MSKRLKAASALSLALTTAAALSVTDATFALEANDSNVPETEIIVDPVALANDQADQTVIFGDQSEIVAEIPESVIEADKKANEAAESFCW